MTFSHLRCCLITVVLLSSGLPSPGASPEFAKPDSGAMQTGDWDVDKVLASQAWREELLDNCQLSWSEVRHTVPNRAEMESSVTMYCRDGLLRLSAREVGTGGWKGMSGTWDTVWDGKLNHSYTWYDREPRSKSGSITLAVPPFLENSRYLRLLGRGLHGDQRLSRRLKQIVEQDQPQVSVTVGVEAGERVVKLFIKNPRKGLPNGREYWFLPDRDFALKRERLWSWASNDDYDKPYDYYYETVTTDFVRHDDLWLSSKYTFELASAGGKEDPEVKIRNAGHGELKSFSTEQPAKDKLVMDFPPGTEVVDAVAMESYVIQPDGSRVYKPIYNAETGKVVPPPAGKPTTSPATQPTR